MYRNTIIILLYQLAVWLNKDILKVFYFRLWNYLFLGLVSELCSLVAMRIFYLRKKKTCFSKKC